MPGQMCWLSSFSSDGDLVLHLRTDSSKPWQVYTLCREFAVPDYDIPRGSRGWATFQKLLKQGWEVIPTAKARNQTYVGALQFISNV